MKKPKQKKPPGNHLETKSTDNVSPDKTQAFAELLEGVEKLPPELRTSILQSISFSGPLPPPEMFGQYEEILKGSADRILTMAEKEQAIRDRDNRKILHNDRLKISGSIIVSLVLIIAGAYAAYLGQPLLGGAFGLGGPILAILREVLRKIK